MVKERAEMTMAEVLQARKALRDARKRERGELVETNNERPTKQEKRQKKTLAAKEHLEAVDSLAEEAAQLVHAMAASGVAQHAGAVALHENDLVQILWPPMVVLRGIAQDSSGKLLRRFPTASHAVPVYNRTFQGSAVLVFKSDDDEHAAGYERAKAVASIAGAAFATWHDGLTWCAQAWAWKLCKHVVGWQKIRPALADGGCPELIGKMVQMQLGANQG